MNQINCRTPNCSFLERDVFPLRTHLCPVLRPVVLPLPAVHEPAVAVVAPVLLAGGGRVVVRGALHAVLARPVALARRTRGPGGRQRVGVLVGRPGEREAEALAGLRAVTDAGARGRRRRRNALNVESMYIKTRSEKSSATWKKCSIHLCDVMLHEEALIKAVFPRSQISLIQVGNPWKSPIFPEKSCYVRSLPNKLTSHAFAQPPQQPHVAFFFRKFDIRWLLSISASFLPSFIHVR